jgi:hypothetical protein
VAADGNVSGPAIGGSATRHATSAGADTRPRTLGGGCERTRGAGRPSLTHAARFVRGRVAPRERSIRFRNHPQETTIVIKQNWTLAVAAAVGVLALAGCNQRESANETAQDVSEARQDATENVAEEKREAGEVATEGSEDRAAAEYDVAVAQADGQRKVAKEKCETLASDAQQACKDQAEATYESAKAQAQAQLDAAKGSGSAAVETPPASTN